MSRTTLRRLPIQRVKTVNIPRGCKNCRPTTTQVSSREKTRRVIQPEQAKEPETNVVLEEKAIEETPKEKAKTEKKGEVLETTKPNALKAEAKTTDPQRRVRRRKNTSERSEKT